MFKRISLVIMSVVAGLGLLLTFTTSLVKASSPMPLQVGIERVLNDSFTKVTATVTNTTAATLTAKIRLENFGDCFISSNTLGPFDLAAGETEEIIVNINTDRDCPMHRATAWVVDNYSETSISVNYPNRKIIRGSANYSNTQFGSWKVGVGVSSDWRIVNHSSQAITLTFGWSGDDDLKIGKFTCNAINQEILTNTLCSVILPAQQFVTATLNFTPTIIRSTKITETIQCDDCENSFSEAFDVPVISNEHCDDRFNSRDGNGQTANHIRNFDVCYVENDRFWQPDLPPANERVEHWSAFFVPAGLYKKESLKCEFKQDNDENGEFETTIIEIDDNSGPYYINGLVEAHCLSSPATGFSLIKVEQPPTTVGLSYAQTTQWSWLNLVFVAALLLMIRTLQIVKP